MAMIQQVVVLGPTEADWNEKVANADDAITSLVLRGLNARVSEHWAGVMVDDDA
jgi:hypothetical protein